MNNPNFYPTKFVDLRTGQETFGFRAADDYDQAYNNTWDSVPEDDLEFLRQIIEDSTDEKVQSMLEFVEENENGVYIDKTYYSWDEIKHLFDSEN
jgi:hypothetical protein